MSDTLYPVRDLLTESQQRAMRRARELCDLFEPVLIMERSMIMSELYMAVCKLFGEVAVRDGRISGLKEELAEKQVDLETAIAEREAAVKKYEEQQARLDKIKADIDADLAGVAPWRDYEDAHKWFIENFPQLVSPRAADVDPVAAVTVPGEMLRAIFIQNSLLQHARFDAVYAQRAIRRLDDQAYDELDAVKKKLATARAVLYHVFLHENSDKRCKYCQNVDQLIPDTKEAYERAESERE